MNMNISRRSNGGAPPACCACKYQRRKCGRRCILAPYFPPERQQQFLNAHKLHGVMKIINMLKSVAPEDRDMTMSTILYHSDTRARDPVGGCPRQIHLLQSQIDYFSAELRDTLRQLAICRGAAASSSSSDDHSPPHSNDIVAADDNNINHRDEPIIIPPRDQDQQQHHQQQPFVEDQLDDDVNKFQPQPQYVDDVLLPEYLDTGEDSIPLSTLFLQDNEREEDEVDQEWVGDEGLDDDVLLPEDLDTWVDSIPLSRLSLEDDKREEDEVDQEWVGDEGLNDDQEPVFDLVNEMNSSSAIGLRHQLQ